MKQIFKYTVPAWPSSYTLTINSEGYFPLTAQMQNGKIALWLEVEPRDDFATTVTVRVVATGGVPPETLEYLGTVQNGSLVWHIYIGKP